MESCCRGTADDDVLDRWVANGFWYLSWFVKQWTTHSGFPRRHPKEYYDEAYRLLDDLAYWYFMGESPSPG
jgi:hypothetical protein